MEKEIEEIEKELKAHSTGGRFGVPKDYFEELPYQVNARVVNKNRGRVVALWSGSFAAVCIVVLAFLLDGGNVEDDVNYYSESVLEEYTEDELMEQLDEEDVIEYYEFEDEY